MSGAKGEERLQTSPWGLIGSGYYDTNNEATALSQLVRVHTPEGVVPREQGYGVSLYTGLCLGATMSSFARDVSPNAGSHTLEEDWPGVSSMPGHRSYEAEQWWKRAMERGLTSRECLDVSDDEDDCREVDLYPFRIAKRLQLAVASFAFESDWKSLPGLWRRIQKSPNHIRDVAPTALLALDVRGLTLEGINLLGILGVYANMSDADLNGLRMRWELNLDPGAPIAQMTLPFKPNSAEARSAERALAQAAEARAAVGWDRLEDLP